MGTKTAVHLPSVWHQIPDTTPETDFTLTSFCVLVECYIDSTLIPFSEAVFLI